MTPEGIFPLFAAYAICAGGVIFFSLFAVAGFLGLTILDIWNSTRYSKSMKLFLAICAALYPEIGVMSWTVYFGKPRKLVFRLIAFGASGVYLLLQIAWFFLSMRDKGFTAGLVSGFMAHIIWWPFVLIGGAVSFFVLRALLRENSSSKMTSETSQESR